MYVQARCLGQLPRVESLVKPSLMLSHQASGQHLWCHLEIYNSPISSGITHCTGQAVRTYTSWHVAARSGASPCFQCYKPRQVCSGATRWSRLGQAGASSSKKSSTVNGEAQTESSFLEQIIEAAARDKQRGEEQPPEPSGQQQCEQDYLELGDRIGFIGAGQMGEALIRGFIATGVSRPEKICASVRSAERQQDLQPLGISIFGNALDEGAANVARSSDIIFLAVKPVYLDPVLEALKPHVTHEHLIISIVAGVKLAALESSLPEGSRVVRVMPNTPCLIGQCASAYVIGNNASEEDSMKTFSLMSAVGMTTSVEERMMDAVTALSGSGPAYVFLIIEALADGAVAAGLPRDKALALAAQTVVGASRMVLEASGDGTISHPAVLKDRVASPAGTTIMGLAELEASGVRGAIIRAVKAAAKRSEELG